MKEEIEEFNTNRVKNGNVNYTVKELIGGLHIKIDKLNKRLDSQYKFCSRNFMSRGSILGGFSIILAIIAFLAYYTFL